MYVKSQEHKKDCCCLGFFLLLLPPSVAYLEIVILFDVNSSKESMKGIVFKYDI